MLVSGATEAFTRALAVELAPVRVNGVSGVVRTPLWDPMGASDRERLFTAQDGTLPVGRVAEPAELATAYRYLMQQTYSTGECVIVDGGSALV